VTRVRRFSQRSLQTPAWRLGATLRRRLLNRFVRAKRVRIVRLGGRRYKRLSLPDASLAAAVAQHLQTFHHARVFPALEAVLDHELLLEFVPGRPLADPLEARWLEPLARFFATLYAVERRRVRTADTACADELQRDLAFLRDVGVLETAVHRDLAATAHAITPPELWIGWDYLDPIPRNFVERPDGSLVAVDVEDLKPDQLIGSGVAKARFRAPGPQREQLLAAVERAARLELAPVMPFVELHCLAAWTKLAYLKGRPKLVDPARFEHYRRKGESSTAQAFSIR